MTKFSQIPPNNSPALADFLIGVTSGGVDDRITLSQLAALVSANLTSSSVTPQKATNPYKFGAYETNGAGVASNVIIFNTKYYDSNTNYNNATGLYTAPVAGFYHFETNVQYASLSAQIVIPQWLKNGVMFQRFSRNDSASGNWSSAAGIDMQLAAGDTVGINAGLQGTARTLEAGYSYFTGHLISMT